MGFLQRLLWNCELNFCGDNCYEIVKLKPFLVLLFLSLFLKLRNCMGFWQIGFGIFFTTVSWSFKRGYGEERNWASKLCSMESYIEEDEDWWYGEETGFQIWSYGDVEWCEQCCCCFHCVWSSFKCERRKRMKQGDWWFLIEEKEWIRFEREAWRNLEVLNWKEIKLDEHMLDICMLASLLPKTNIQVRCWTRCSNILAWFSVTCTLPWFTHAFIYLRNPHIISCWSSCVLLYTE